MNPDEWIVRLRPEGNRPPAFRIVLADSQGRLLTPEPPGIGARAFDDFVWGYGTTEARFRLAPGTYHYCVSAGPAWTMLAGSVTVGGKPPRPLDVALTRIADPRQLGWMAGDAHAHPTEEVGNEALARMFAAEDIDVAGMQHWGLYTTSEQIRQPPDTAWRRVGHTWVSADEEIEMHSPWGPWEDTTVIGLAHKLPDLRRDFGYRMNAPFYRQARAQGCALIAYQAPIWTQFPVDVALGLVDSVNLCDNFFSIMRATPWTYSHFGADDPLRHEPFGMAHWIFRHYYRILNAGFILPASGGSAFPGGGGGGPIGMNRFYAQTGGATDHAAYLSAWRQGRTFATNGPLLFAAIGGREPSRAPTHTLRASKLDLRVVSNRPIDLVEWVADGKVIAAKSLASTPAPVDITWQMEADLTSYQWVAARCFGRSERTLVPEGGRISPPFLVAHTSPFYTERHAECSSTRRKAVGELLEHLDWMEAVINGKAAAPGATLPFAATPLNEAQKKEIAGLLNEARGAYRNKLSRPPSRGAPKEHSKETRP